MFLRTSSISYVVVHSSVSYGAGPWDFSLKQPFHFAKGQPPMRSYWIKPGFLGQIDKVPNMDKSSVYDDQSIIHELSQTRSPSRKELLFKHVITDDKNESILNAYKVKHKIVKSTSKPSLIFKIDTNAPIVSAPEGKFNHHPGARISPITMTPSKILLQTQQQAFTEKTMACKGSPVHAKLADVNTFPLVIRKRHQEHRGGGAMFEGTGDIIDNATRYSKLLKGVSNDQLTIPGRAADFKDEVAWRMQLRN